ncbi:redoxin domain-containing protein [Brevibacillus laterosporus]|uniref:Redoxin domain-containing protein n=1 Tax=Brevibacillus laterosporus TaxID=1465 RepID=A0AAP8QFR5_BRELA|nr:redoxin domain-containing protein [Brevibacillus laterosporus]ATO48912.1 thiol-disulfide oxidoreductase [Brevibacillus laterosporus DSM 25]MBG9803232.1 thiol-disulfide oxidoreductase [Brevibacillus laterosporus]MCR8978755.1 redoxin domain-containing protein [Brevibacillus laterosporus]MCZ0805911.1 redoxin domain-containing protein [Brevibacillus laterosporus]MCZ0828850.1 redoxin domain-containing protein [Brevibacillus laterosporus]
MRLREELPDFPGITEWVNGQVSKADLQGERAVLVHFWSVSCYMCKESLPQINEWRDKYADQGLKVIGIHMPRSEADTDIAKIKETIAQYELTHPVAIDNEMATTDAFQNEYVPAYYLFDETMALRHFQAGEKGLNMVKKRLHRILGIEED